MKVAAIGDNCIDVYEKLNKKYPTGNVVDTGVNIQKLGIPVSIISTTGTDDNGRWMKETLAREKVDLSHFKIMEGQTAITHMDVDGIERIHGEYEEGVLGSMVFDEEDIRFASEHNLVHSALWGKAENAIVKIKEKNKDVLISFDYADRLNHSIIEKTLQCVDYGFFSYHGVRDDIIEDYLIDKVKRGMKIAIVTFGEQGSLAYDGKRFYEGKIYETEVVNTVGAGDGFIAGFLYELLRGNEIKNALDTGAKVAAENISVFEPWVI